MKQSAGILLFKADRGAFSFLLVHPGGPFWKNKDEGSWSIPKGEFTEAELPLEAALREFKEETGFELDGDFLPLTPIRQKSGKTVHAFAQQRDIDASTIKSNTFEMEWPPKSGKIMSFPEVDQAEWFSEIDALVKINPAQAAFIRALILHLSQ